MGKKIIQIEITYPNCDMLFIDKCDERDILSDVLNDLCCQEDVDEGRWSANIQVISDDGVDYQFPEGRIMIIV